MLSAAAASPIQDTVSAAAIDPAVANFTMFSSLVLLAYAC
jgi:hypothetical protein